MAIFGGKQLKCITTLLYITAQRHLSCKHVSKKKTIIVHSYILEHRYKITFIHRSWRNFTLAEHLQ